MKSQLEAEFTAILQIFVVIRKSIGTFVTGGKMQGSKTYTCTIAESFILTAVACAVLAGNSVRADNARAAAIIFIVLEIDFTAVGQIAVSISKSFRAAVTAGKMQVFKDDT